MRPGPYRDDESVDLPLPPPSDHDDGPTSTGVFRFTRELGPPVDPHDSVVPAIPLDATEVQEAIHEGGDTERTTPFERADIELMAGEHTEVEATRPETRSSRRLPLPALPPEDDHAAPGSATEIGSVNARLRRDEFGPGAPPRRPHRGPTAPPLRQPPPPPQPADAPSDRQASLRPASRPTADEEQPLIGGRYRVVSRIGEGGMGKVLKVKHAQLGKVFALKIIHDSAATEEKARESFFREARLASSLSHPNVASVVDFGEDPNFGAFMVMEYLEGEMLSVVLHRAKRLRPPQACDILLQIGEALHYIHQHNVVHCDIKAENILLCEVPGTKRRKQEVKLLDFGLARSTAHRQTTSLSGTPHYVAPERIRGEPASPLSDLYGLGILFYELLTGRVPWNGNVAEILCGHLEKRPPPLGETISEEVEPALENLVFKALSKDPRDRHKDMAGFLYELRTVMDMMGIGRRRKSSNRRKIVIERQGSQRDELCRALFDAHRLPVAMINPRGLIVLANAAFSKFVMGVAVDVEGLTVQATPLVGTWHTFEMDLERACKGDPVRRIVEIDLADGEVRKLLMWLDPAPVGGNAVFGVHPVDL